MRVWKQYLKFPMRNNLCSQGILHYILALGLGPKREDAMQQIKSVEIMSVAKIFRVMYGCMAMIFIPFFLLAGLGTMFAGRESGRIRRSVHDDFCFPCADHLRRDGFRDGSVDGLDLQFSRKTIWRH